MANTESESEKTSSELAGQSMPNLSDTKMSNNAENNFSANDLVQAMVQQQNVLLQTLQAIKACAPTNKETQSVNAAGPSKQDNESEAMAPVSYDLEEISSENECSDSDIDNDELQEMQKLYDDSDNVSVKIHDKLAENINLSFRKKLSKENQNSMMDKFKRPENCHNMTVPKVNIEFWEEANSAARAKDIQLARAQSLLTKAAVPLTQMAQKCLEKRKKDISISECTDAMVLLSSAFTEITQLRREMFKSTMSSQYKNRLCSTDNEPSTKWIFGDDLAKKMKEIQDTQTVSSKLQKERSYSLNRYKPYPKKNNFQKGKQPMNRKPFLGKRYHKAAAHKHKETRM